jgi:hypothetical protein
MAPAPREPRPGNRQARGLAVVTITCLVLVSAYSAVLRSDGWLWFAWTVLVLITAALFTVKQ